MKPCKSWTTQSCRRADLIVSLPSFFLGEFVRMDGKNGPPTMSLTRQDSLEHCDCGTPHIQPKTADTCNRIGSKVLSFLATHSASAVLTFDELGVSGRCMSRMSRLPQIHFLYSTKYLVFPCCARLLATTSCLRLARPSKSRLCFGRRCGGGKW